MSRRLLDQYVEAGGTFLDTANVYAQWVEGGHGGESEHVLGRWMKDRGHRDTLFLATKVGFGYPGTEDDPGVAEGLSARQIERECEKSLKRMGVDHIDLYYAHYDHRAVPLEETLAAFDRLVRAGKVRFLGASNHHAWRLADALAVSRENRWTPYCCVQQRYTYVRPKPGADFTLWPAASPDFLDQCKAKDLGVIAYSPLLHGGYVKPERVDSKYHGPDTDARMKALRDMAARRNATVHQIVLAWLMQSDPVVIPLFSASKPEQMTEDLGALDVTLSDKERKGLNEAGA
jgi:aryl-alcohol dehydrogenase-like predicted oxidoreductase